MKTQAQRPNTKREALAMVRPFPKEKRPAAFCVLVGHSRMIESCFGQLTCGRCGAVVGDTLAGADTFGQRLVRGHGRVRGSKCKDCPKIAKTLDWRDTTLVEFTPKEWMAGAAI